MIFKILFWLTLFCIFSFTLGQFIPIYFVDHEWRLIYYPTLLIITSLAIPTLVYRRIYNPKKSNWISSTLYTLLVFASVIVVFGFITLGKCMVIWTDAETYYVNKNNPEVKIISRYSDLGAFGGGTEPTDYEMVLSRPITSQFKLQTKIDTTKINKAEWIKPSSN